MTIPEQLAKALADLAAANDALAAERANVTTLTASLEEANKKANECIQEAFEANAKLDLGKAQVAELNSEIASLKAAAKTASEQATEMAARIGVKPVAAEGKDRTVAADMTLDEVRAAMAKTSDPKEKGRLALISRKLRGLD